MLLKCGIQYEFRYIHKLRLPPSASLVRGKVSHEVCEDNFRQKIETKEDLPVEEVKDLFSTHWEEEKYAIAFTEKELDGSTPKKVMGQFKDTGIGMIEVFHKEQSPLILPEHVEKKFIIEFEGGYPHLMGIWDVLDEKNINELKFVSKSPPADDLLYDIQVTCEDYGYRNTFKKLPEKLIKRYTVATKIPKTVVQEMGPRDDETIKRFLFRLENAMGIIERGQFQPAPIGSWWCSPDWCGYWQKCKYRP